MTSSNEASGTSTPISSGKFDIKATYLKFLADDPEMTMPVAAIESLVSLLSITQPSTSSELIMLLEEASTALKTSVKNSVSLSAGCDLFMRFVLRNINEYGDWEACKRHLVANGRVFVERAKASRQKIADVGLPFIRDDNVILVHSQSRTVQALLLNAASKFTRFRVYVTESRISNQGRLMAQTLRSHGIPTCVIPDASVGYVIDKVDKIFFGAEGVAESGGVINQMGSYQIAVLAKNAKKPVYVVAESHKFVRLFPISPSDIPNEYQLEFTTADASEDDMTKSPQIDFTPHQYVTALITDLGVLTTSGVSEELIKIWFD
ncbi:translation initiation factor eIF2B subunit alpha [Trichomonascus vanleenenianus]|uniref:translation initiation factor eIF2B subunit alpha n=1 Tax=Trichomonascus vanleenenianus TaxID=2268995 RepID=UPI003ECB0880